MTFGAAGFGGWMWLTFVVLLVLVLVGALSVVVDVARRLIVPRANQGRRWTLLGWALPQAALLAAAAAGQLVRANATLSSIIGALFLIAAPVQIGYVVRVTLAGRSGTAAPDETRAETPSEP